MYETDEELDELRKKKLEECARKETQFIKELQEDEKAEQKRKYDEEFERIHKVKEPEHISDKLFRWVVTFFLVLIIGGFFILLFKNIIGG